MRSAGAGDRLADRVFYDRPDAGEAACEWITMYPEIDNSGAKRLKALEDENAKLKKLLAEAMLDNAMLEEVASNKWRRPLGSEWLSLICGPPSR
jgi:putative transposase